MGTSSTARTTTATTPSGSSSSTGRRAASTGTTTRRSSSASAPPRTSPAAASSRASRLYTDIDKSRKNQQAKRWSNWRTFNSNYKNILDGDQYVQVQVALNADRSMRTKNREYQEIKSVEVRSE